MYLSKPNLLIVSAASDDVKRGPLCGLHISHDGSTIASDGFVMIAVEPLKQASVVFPDVGALQELSHDGATLDKDTVLQAVKNMPRDAVMQIAAMTERRDGMMEFTTVNRKNEHRVAGRPFRGKFAEWRSMLKGAFSRAKATKVCLSRKRLIKLLQLMDQACPGPGANSPIFLEIGGPTDAIILRSINYVTGQRVVAMFRPLDIKDEWLPLSQWEARLFAQLHKKEKVNEEDE